MTIIKLYCILSFLLVVSISVQGQNLIENSILERMKIAINVDDFEGFKKLSSDSNFNPNSQCESGLTLMMFLMLENELKFKYFKYLFDNHPSSFFFISENKDLYNAFSMSIINRVTKVHDYVFASEYKRLEEYVNKDLTYFLDCVYSNDSGLFNKLFLVSKNMSKISLKERKILLKEILGQNILLGDLLLLQKKDNLEMKEKLNSSNEMLSIVKSVNFGTLTPEETADIYINYGRSASCLNYISKLNLRFSECVEVHGRRYKLIDLFKENLSVWVLEWDRQFSDSFYLSMENFNPKVFFELLLNRSFERSFKKIWIKFYNYSKRKDEKKLQKWLEEVK